MGVGRMGPEVVKFYFYPSELKKQPVFANNVTIHGGKAPLPHLLTPMAMCFIAGGNSFSGSFQKQWKVLKKHCEYLSETF